METVILDKMNPGFWTEVARIYHAGIFPENTGSIKLHQKHGFRIVGTREKIGKIDNRWRDVILLERRSRRTGSE